MADVISGKILPDGSLKLETDRISGPNHMKAENLLAFLGRGLGGKIERTSRGKISAHEHIHEHTHEHTHEH